MFYDFNLPCLFGVALFVDDPRRPAQYEIIDCDICFLWRNIGFVQFEVFSSSTFEQRCRFVLELLIQFFHTRGNRFDRFFGQGHVLLLGT